MLLSQSCGAGIQTFSLCSNRALRVLRRDMGFLVSVSGFIQACSSCICLFFLLLVLFRVIISFSSPTMCSIMALRVSWIISSVPILIPYFFWNTTSIGRFLPHLEDISKLV